MGIHGELHCGDAGIVIADIEGGGDAFRELRSDVLRAFDVHVANDDLRAFFAQTDGQRFAKALRRAGNENNFVLETGELALFHK